ncbi:hypothetical protein MTO96_017659 [Rhipicephalus appendiculatus]
MRRCEDTICRGQGRLVSRVTVRQHTSGEMPPGCTQIQGTFQQFPGRACQHPLFNFQQGNLCSQASSGRNFLEQSIDIDSRPVFQLTRQQVSCGALVENSPHCRNKQETPYCMNCVTQQFGACTTASEVAMVNCGTSG